MTEQPGTRRRASRRHGPVGVALAVLVCGAPLAAQAEPGAHPSADSALLARADSLHTAGETERVLDELRAHLTARDSTGYALLWRAARAAAVHGATVPGPYPQNHYFEEGMRWGALAEAEAVRTRSGPSGRPLPPGSPPDVSGAYWGLTATGLRAQNAAPGYGAELADSVWGGGYALLDRAPADPRVHSLLGLLHLRVMTLPAAERRIGRILFGGRVLDGATWDDAERHLTRAVELAPADLGYLMDLARLHDARGRPTAARMLAQRVVAAPADTHADRQAVRRARDFLKRSGR